MIRSFNHRGLKALWENSDGSKLDGRMMDRITRRLDALDAVIRPQEMDQPGFDFHTLTGKRRGRYTVHVNRPGA
jgi:toxin HigB-1